MGLIRIILHLSFLLVITASSHISSNRRAVPRTISFSPSSRGLAAALRLPRRRGFLRSSYGSDRTPSRTGTATVVLTPFGYLKRHGGSSNANTRIGSSRRLLNRRRLEPIRVSTSTAANQDSLISLQPPLAETIFGIESEPVSASFTSSLSSISSVPSGLSRPGPRATTGSRDLVSNSVLMLLINSRANSTRTFEDEIAISDHLIALEEIQRTGDTAMGSSLERQLQYIEGILEQDIQRETLKLFAKDIVEKSGFMSATSHSATDTARLMSLVDMLSDINNRFNQRSLVSGITNTNSKLISPVSFDNPIAPSSERISNALLTLSNSPGLPNVHDTSLPQKQQVLSSFKSRFGMSDGLSSYGSSRVRAGTRSRPTAVRERDRIRLMVGKSIYGGRPRLFLRRPIARPVVRPIATTTKAPARKREPLGGSSGYWTHLRSGLADLLCRLCQQAENQPCITRYCNNESSAP